MLRTLHSGAGLGVLMDQHVQSDAVVVNFFDRPAATTALIGALAVRSGATVIPLFALPVNGGRYRVVYEHPVDPPSDESEDALTEFAQRWTDVLEMYVRRYPEQWLWMHRRWRA
jgi:KDO2-lipid IV(A) lauroyltransferase